MSFVVIPREERYLQAHFGDEYAGYKASVFGAGLGPTGLVKLMLKPSVGRPRRSRSDRSVQAKELT